MPANLILTNLSHVIGKLASLVMDYGFSKNTRDTSPNNPPRSLFVDLSFATEIEIGDQRWPLDNVKQITIRTVDSRPETNEYHVHY